MLTPYWLLLVVVLNGNTPQTTVNSRHATFEECRDMAETGSQLLTQRNMLVCVEVSNKRIFTTAQGTWK